MAIYQQCEPTDVTRVVEVKGAAKDRSLSDPDVILHLMKCGCQKTRCATKPCACAKANLSCTDMCRCMDTDELCANTAAHQESDASGEDEEGENDECDDDEDSEDIF